MQLRRAQIIGIAIAVAIVLLMVVFVILRDGVNHDVYANGETPEQPVFTVSEETVVILVVDTFPPLDGMPLRERDELSDGNCLTTPDGQGHLVVDEAGHLVVDEAGHLVVDEAGHLVVDEAGNTVELRTHGQLVYAQFQDLLREQGGSQQQSSSGQDTLNVEWIRSMEIWQQPEGEVVLMALDTEGYTTEVIASRIPAALDLMANTYDVSRFVVNMSFAVVPCDSLYGDNPSDPEKLERYREALAEEFPELAEVFDELLEQANGDLTIALNLPEFPPEARLVIQRERMAEVHQKFYDNGVERAYETLDECYVLPRQADVQQDAPAEQATEVPQDPGGQLDGCTDPFFAEDPLFQVYLDVLPPTGLRERTSTPEDDATRQVISIASAGNLGMAFPFAPGYYPSVVSVSAEYEGADFGDLQPLSNAGEVQMNGLYTSGGLTNAGTSFAAPRLSVEAAIYLLEGGNVTCSGNQGVSSPPLAHPDWNNLPRADASTEYCSDFNALVDQ
ncbi:MAG: hypothetical protein GYB66_07430 [Chloroflexi bacterium]|nr:hypothetical protein [Chloroflexota bacterium]